jgi:hypothetical protein
MRRMLPLAVLFTSALVFLSLPAQATEVYKFKFSGLGTSAFFYSEEGPIIFYSDLWIGESVTHEKGGVKVTTEWMGLFVEVVNTETWEYLVSAWGSADLPAGTLELSKQLKSAAVEAEVELYNWVTDSTLLATVDMSWAPAEGEKPYQSSGRNHFRSAGVRGSNKFKGTFQPAAASGTISLSGVGDFPSQSWYAEMYSVTSMDMAIYQ